MAFELSYENIAVIFFLTLGPLKVILPFARATRGTEPAFQRAVARRAVAISTIIVLAVALRLTGVLPVIGWVLAVLQASLAVQMVIYSLRLLEVLRWPAS
jgi:multiple antibiotic resistance protein